MTDQTYTRITATCLVVAALCSIAHEHVGWPAMVVAGIAATISLVTYFRRHA